MKNLFVMLGLIISLSLITLILSLTTFTLTGWPAMAYVVKVEFAILALSGLVFAATLIVIPHGRRN